MKIFTLANLTVSILIVGAYTLGHWHASNQFLNKSLTPPASQMLSPVNTQGENSSKTQPAQAKKEQIKTQQHNLEKSKKQAVSDQSTLPETNSGQNKTDPELLHKLDTNEIADPMQQLLDETSEIEASLADFEAEFWSSAEDPSATEEAEVGLRETFKQQNLQDSEFDKVQCQTGMCVAEFVHQQEKSHDILLQKLYGIKPFSRGFLVKTDASGERLRTLVFFPREGESLTKYINIKPGEI